jgi:hypothetical protein
MTKQHEWSNMPNGYTVGIYFPPSASETVTSRAMERIAQIMREELDVEGAVWKIDHDCECCAPHVYLSTSCFHGNHTYCQTETGLIGVKIPGECKFCHSPCICPCHRETETENDTVDG